MGPCKSWSAPRPERPPCAELGQDSCPTASGLLYSTENLLFLWVGMTECTSWKGALEGSNPTSCSRELQLNQDVQAIINPHIPTKTQILQLLQSFYFPCTQMEPPFSQAVPHTSPGHVCLCLFHTLQEEMHFCDCPSLDDKQLCTLSITQPTPLLHIHLSDRKRAPCTMEMKHKHAERLSKR